MTDWRFTYCAWSSDGVHLVIERIDKQPIRAKWDVLQQIKDDILGEDVCAIEIYPPIQDVVNEVNRRHLWAVPEELVAAYNMARR